MKQSATHAPLLHTSPVAAARAVGLVGPGGRRGRRRADLAGVRRLGGSSGCAHGADQAIVRLQRVRAAPALTGVAGAGEPVARARGPIGLHRERRLRGGRLARLGRARRGSPRRTHSRPRPPGTSRRPPRRRRLRPGRPPSCTRPPRGSCTSGSVPLVTAAQVPVVTPVSALVHAMHVPVQAALQHTPCVQKPVAHSLAETHGAPCAGPRPRRGAPRRGGRRRAGRDRTAGRARRACSPGSPRWRGRSR